MKEISILKNKYRVVFSKIKKIKSNYLIRDKVSFLFVVFYYSIIKIANIRTFLCLQVSLGRKAFCGMRDIIACIKSSITAINLIVGKASCSSGNPGSSL